jgi:alanyl-tRNA synthetase
MPTPRSSREVRETFLDFFVERGHVRIADASLVPRDDPTLLYVNAGMAPLKRYFTGEDRPAHPDLCNVQPCIRTTDIEDVGDRHHLTFFEMLGSWSIDHYFKERAIELAFELLTTRFGLEPERLYATVFRGDADRGLPADEASADFWEQVGLARDHVVPLGLDNFWGPAGDFGPCGPCTEVFIDTGDDFGAAYVPGGEFDTTGRYIEIWNAGVFMSFDKRPDGSYSPLPFGSVDTGSGLERLVMALAGLPSVYETDLLAPVVAVVREAMGRDATPEQIRLLSDHVRAASMILAEGVRPSNEGRGYVPRRLIRKAIAVAHRAGVPDYDFRSAIDTVVDLLGDVYPRLVEHRSQVHELFSNERADFGHVVARGLARLEAAYSEPPFRIDGGHAFDLFSTYGLPLEIVRDFAREHGGDVDIEGFEARFREHQEVSRVISGSHGGEVEGWPSNDARFEAAGELPETRFIGHQALEGSSTLLALLVESEPVEEVYVTQRVEVVVGETPFYAEGGGQVGDTGVIAGPSGSLTVLDTQKTRQGYYVHRCTVADGTVAVGEAVRLSVDAERRRAIMRNHSATHLLHASLREVLGDHVKQAGSLVEAARLRFDFEHGAALTADERQQVERLVNDYVFADVERVTNVLPYEEAISSGALAFFDENYGDEVRVVSFDGLSTELCGGTHVAESGDVNYFRIVSEGSVAAGVRRVVAVTGRAALDYTLHRDALLSSVATQLSVGVDDLPERIEKLREQATKRAAPAAPRVDAGSLVAAAAEASGTPYVASRVEVSSKDLRVVALEVAERAKAVVVLATVEDGKAAVVVVVPGALQERNDAGDILRSLLPHVEGRGGGKGGLAQGGGPKADGVAALLEAVPAAIAGDT